MKRAYYQICDKTTNTFRYFLLETSDEKDMNFWETEIDVFSLRGENQSSRGRFKQFVHFTPILNRESTQILMRRGLMFMACNY